MDAKTNEATLAEKQAHTELMKAHAELMKAQARHTRALAIASERENEK